MENLVSLKKCKWHLKAGKLRVTAIVLLEKEEEKEGGRGNVNNSRTEREYDQPVQILKFLSIIQIRNKLNVLYGSGLC